MKDELLTADQRRLFYLAKTATNEEQLGQWLRANKIDIADMMDGQTRNNILIWAQQQVDTRNDVADDWWHAFDGRWDINIWDGEEDDDHLTVTAYLIFDNGTDTCMSEYVRVGRVYSKREVTA
jgi:hypothetical protein